MVRTATLFATVLAVCTSAYAASQEIWNPKITSPSAGTVWPAGSVQEVTWDTSDAPSSISEASKVILAKGGVEDVSNPLAQGFDLRAGKVSVTVPMVAAGADYEIVLFGDSGNLSPDFSIA